MIAPLLSLSAFLFLLCHLLQVQQWSRGFRGAFLQDGATPKAASANPAEVSIVLPVRNEAETLPQLLLDLAAGTSMPKEVIVVDDDSVDGTLEAIAAMGSLPFPLHSMSNPGKGKKPGLSAGIRAAAHPWVIQVDADVRVGPHFVQSIAQHLRAHGPQTDMLLLPLRLAYSTHGAPQSTFEHLQALDFAAMQGWAVAAARRQRPAMASGGAWVWRKTAFPHEGLRPDLASGDDVFALASLIQRGDGARVGWCGQPDSMASAAPMPDFQTLLDQRIRWGAKSAAYPKALSEARRVATIIAGVHALGAALLIVNPLAGGGFWLAKAAIDMTYTHLVGRAYGLFNGMGAGRRWGTLALLAAVHPMFIITTLLLMPFRKAPWKGRAAA